MRLGTLASAALAFAMLGAAAAQAAAPGYTTANVNMRTGPDIDFPSIGIIPEGDDIFVVGCLRDESWCDVRWGPERGWVYAEYLGFDYHGETVLLPDIGLSLFAIPVIAFVADDYWGRYYVGRPWYRDRVRWYRFRPRPRVGWHAPPPGPRKRDWWRKNYHAPKGLLAPPARGWKRPARVKTRHEQREEHRRHRKDRRDERWGDRH
jgi:uncharacterized protein YraI